MGGKAEEEERKGEVGTLVEVVVVEEMLVEEVMRRNNGLHEANLIAGVLWGDLGGTLLGKNQPRLQLPISFQLPGSQSRRCGTCREKGE